MKRLRVSMLPLLTHPHKTAGTTVLIVDVLRASTTIASALAAGANQIVPCLEIDEAQNQKRQLVKAGRPGDQILLGGERGGKPIAGFDLGNSPIEYRAEVVSGRTICFTTTNGTKAMMRCTGAARVVVAAFVNLSATYVAVQEDDEVNILCAGTNDEVTREDVLFAGAFADRVKLTNPDIDLNDEARLAIDAWRYLNPHRPNRAESISVADLAAEFRKCNGGKNLVAIGRDEDLAFAAEIDRFNVAPELDLSTWRIGLP